jgi:histone-lysine N-methyltransferase SETMAR
MEDLKIQQRSVVRFLTLEGQTPKDIHPRLQNVYGQEALSRTQVYFWAAETKRGRIAVQDEERSGRPSDAASEQNIEAVENLVMGNRRIKVWEIEAETALSRGTIFRILHEHLLLSKVTARWVPRNLSALDKRRRVECASAALALMNDDQENFFARIVTGDETWLRNWDPETKQESMQWKHTDSPAPKKFRTQPSAQKLMATIFWDCEGILLIDYLPPKTTITGLYYGNLIRKLRDVIKEKRRGKVSAGILLLHDNAPVHKAQVAMAAIRESGFDEIDHPPYSPDLAPSDFFLFPNLKKNLRGRRFEDVSEIVSATQAYFTYQDKTFFSDGLKLLKQRYSKCIALKGDYVEK